MQREQLVRESEVRGAREKPRVPNWGQSVLGRNNYSTHELGLAFFLIIMQAFRSIITIPSIFSRMSPVLKNTFFRAYLEHEIGTHRQPNSEHSSSSFVKGGRIVGIRHGFFSLRGA